MKQEIADAIKILAEKVTKTCTPDEALKFTQAALNLAHTKQVLSQTPSD